MCLGLAEGQPANNKNSCPNICPSHQQGLCQEAEQTRGHFQNRASLTGCNSWPDVSTVFKCWSIDFATHPSSAPSAECQPLSASVLQILKTSADVLTKFVWGGREMASAACSMEYPEVMQLEQWLLYISHSRDHITRWLYKLHIFSNMPMVQWLHCNWWRVKDKWTLLVWWVHFLIFSK